MNRLFDPQRELGRALLALRHAFFQAAGFSFVINLLMLVPTLYMLQIYDRVLSSRNGMTLLMLTLIMLALYALMGILEWVRSGLLIRIGTRLEKTLGERVFTAAFTRHLYRMGGNPAQATQDLAKVRQFVSGPGMTALFDAPWAPVYLLVICLIHPWLGLFALVAMLVLSALAWINELVTHKLLDEANKENVAAVMYANNNLRNAESIQAMGMLPAIRERWMERQQKLLGLQVLVNDRGGLVSSISKTTRIAFQSLILGLGGLLAINGEITPGGMIAGSILMGRALSPVDQLISAWKQWLAARASYDQLSELLTKIPVPAEAMSLPAPQGAISIEGLSMVPPGGKTAVLRNLSIRINPADVVAVIGPSAAGKSTFARALVGVWPPAAGNVRLDGVDVFTWDKAELGPHVGYLSQDIALFEGTVAENIARFGELDSEKVVAAAQLTGVHDMILHLPAGYETQVGTDGGALSGGQRQRIGLARALYGNPRLVVLDEPNSNLDEAGEGALLQAISVMKESGCTVVFVSHGPGLLAAADKLLVLREGNLVVYGPRDQVIAHLKNPTPQVVSGGGQR